MLGSRLERGLVCLQCPGQSILSRPDIILVSTHRSAADEKQLISHHGELVTPPGSKRRACRCLCPVDAITRIPDIAHCVSANEPQLVVKQNDLVAMPGRKRGSRSFLYPTDSIDG